MSQVGANPRVRVYAEKEIAVPGLLVTNEGHVYELTERLSE